MSEERTPRGKPLGFLALVVLALLGAQLWWTGGRLAWKIPPGERDTFQAQALVNAAQAYRAAFGRYPTGSNAEITDRLTGDNARRTEFILIPESMRNARGECTTSGGAVFDFAASGTAFAVKVGGKVLASTGT